MRWLSSCTSPIAELDSIKTVLSIVAVPIEGLVSVLYWGMKLVDPSLLVPPDSRFIISTALDISIHALPALFLWSANNSTHSALNSPPLARLR